ncbi:DUF5134 domain-containing protein [Nocardioides guangzhouensis]|uniref:DUF5134 domain-containing protein n=1 Tax=Nocardioides guangzhouensis TaxID=2497878 RepID=A0A4Q4ZIZ4_9ACTN|nr:DUF5134 domain-containing protein [Nocardioides guangzhouensis]RYP88252.1 DUF5134 domain-containing protein [Nocardioides guangzhouensis]
MAAVLGVLGVGLGVGLDVGLGVVMVGVAGWCLARSLTRGPGPDGHRRDLDAWHAVMGAGMAVMLLAPLGRPLATAGLVLFGAGLAWSLVRALRSTGRWPSVALGVGCAAMAAMLVPVATAPAASAASGTEGTAGRHHMAGMEGMHHAAPTGASGGAAVDVPTALLLVLVVLLAAVVALRLTAVVRRGEPARTRLDAACEVLMGATMAAMLVPLV